MPANLKPCPFCGGTNLSIELNTDVGKWCVFCACCGPACFEKYERDSVHNWNERAEIKEVKILQSATPTNSDYEAALRVWDEFGNNGNGAADSQFGWWVQQRLHSAENTPNVS